MSGPGLTRASGRTTGFESASSVLSRTHGELFISERKLKRSDELQIVRVNRDADTQTLGFAARPFVLCGLPVRRPAHGQLLFERRNGPFVLSVTGHPRYGLPWGQDRLVPIFLATLAVKQRTQTVRFRSAAEMLDTFGLQQGGTQYRRLLASFKRVFGATIFFGTDAQLDRARVFEEGRFNFMTEARIWYSRDRHQETLTEGFENLVMLSDEFYREVLDHPIPADLDAVKTLSSAPAALDFFMWLSYRCHRAKGEERIPLFGAVGLANQLGSASYARPRRFWEKVQEWLDLVKVMWPQCPARISNDGSVLVVAPASAVNPKPQF